MPARLSTPPSGNAAAASRASFIDPPTLMRIKSLAGRAHVNADDIRALTPATFRHRILINYRAEAEGVNVERVIGRLLETVK